MKCKNCGAEIPNDVKNCPYCEAAVGETPIQNEVQEAVSPSKTATNETVLSSQGSLNGKKYIFTSASGTNLAGIFNSKVISNVEVAEDRLFIDIKPKRFNTSPAVLFEDITGIDIAVKINLYYWLWIIISAAVGIAAPFCFIFTIIFIFCGLQRKITISQRNGIKVVMYSSSKAKAEEFKEDMKTVTKIH
jgi:hypothetical protein